jgi:hypothetical protein
LATSDSVSLNRFVAERLPARRELIFAFALCAFPIYSWAVIQFLDRLPGWLFYLKIWDMVGIFAYSQLFALIETFLVLGGLIVLAFVLPQTLFRRRFVAVVLVLILFATGGAVAFHYVEQALRAARYRELSIGVAIYGLFFLTCYLAALHWSNAVEIAENIADHLTTLLYLYLPVSVLSGVLVLVRNLL